MVDSMSIFEKIFRNTDIFNPIALQTLHAAGKLAQLSPEKTLIELGCGKGFPALFWASAFGIQVEGVDLSQAYVDYANARARLLNLQDQTYFSVHDLKTFSPTKKYDFVSFLGVGTDVYGGKQAAFDVFRNMLKPGGAILFSEPIWTAKPVPPPVLQALRCTNDTFLTMTETRQLWRHLKLEELGCFVASKEDWELYVRAPLRSLKEMILQPELVAEASGFLEDFRMEHEAAGRDWDDVLWVVKPG
jgi:2-polyprenyl-3-methyl-5-hydroxy-6-metoxy-1,4-benzoquinol methylase